jgi:hypothetical protein
MPLPLYNPPTIQPLPEPKAKLWEPVPKKQILGHFTHKKMEDRISQRTWYENVTYPDELATSLIRARNIKTSAAVIREAISSSHPRMQ